MEELKRARALLDEINAAVASYDPVLKERARDILLERAFGTVEAGGGTRAAEQPGRSGVGSGRLGRAGTAVARRSASGLGELVRQWTPQTMAERALLGAYSLSRGRADRPVTSQAINTELKRNGLPVPNITRAIEANLRTHPPLMVQKKKMGLTRQARKQYAITPDGVEAVENRLGGAKSART